MKRLLLLATLGLAPLAPAHYLWATLDPTARTVAVGLQEIPGDAPLPLGDRVPRVKAWTADAASLPLKADGPWLRAPTGASAVAVSLDYGILDRRESGRGLFWLGYFAKSAATPEASKAKLGLPVELSVAKAADGRETVTVWSDGKPASGADVVVERPVGTNAFEGRTGPDGTVALPPSNGPLAVRALVTSEGKGTHDGQAYDLVRRYGTLTVAAPAATNEAAKPLSRQMHDAFGNAHDVVSHTAFIETVMAGGLTRAQLVDHLRQREIVNAAIDERLRDAPGVPYGPAQREVLTLLRANLEQLGAGTPTEDQAWPLTKAFIAEIRQEGPFFALGVFHVYYGGITNGGRDIGAMIAEQTKFSPTYYLKSDGYLDYLKRLNATVVDPEAQRSAVRGGQAAYRYIIAVNGDPSFKAR